MINNVLYKLFVFIDLLLTKLRNSPLRTTTKIVPMILILYCVSHSIETPLKLLFGFLRKPRRFSSVRASSEFCPKIRGHSRGNESITLIIYNCERHHCLQLLLNKLQHNFQDYLFGHLHNVVLEVGV